MLGAEDRAKLKTFLDKVGAKTGDAGGTRFSRPPASAIHNDGLHVGSRKPLLKQVQSIGRSSATSGLGDTGSEGSGCARLAKMSGGTTNRLQWLAWLERVS
jgi:hypothetical protein